MIWPALRKAFRATTMIDQESRVVLSMAARLQREGARRLLDVGCGFGRYLRPLGASGYQVVGVDANRQAVSANTAAGLHCLHPDDLPVDEPAFDVILLSHIIEHFTPEHLLRFLDGYLERLSPGGHVIIATPLLSPYFHDDFDHVKPYHPIGLLMVFGGDGAQVQYYARNRLALRDLWFRRSPWRGSHLRCRYLPGPATRLLQVAEFLAAVAFRLSGGLLGRTDGWVGVFEKLPA